MAQYAASNSWTNANKYTVCQIDENVKVEVQNGGSNSGKYYNTGTSWRMYASENPDIVITANGKTIKSIKITWAPSSNGALTLNDETTIVNSDESVNVNDTSFTFKTKSTSGTTGKVYITDIEVVYIY